MPIDPHRPLPYAHHLWTENAERRLFAAVLYQAVVDLYSIEHRAAAYRWLTDPRSTCRQFCVVIDMEMTTVIAGVNKLVKNARSRHRFRYGRKGAQPVAPPSHLDDSDDL